MRTLILTLMLTMPLLGDITMSTKITVEPNSALSGAPGMARKEMRITGSYRQGKARMSRGHLVVIHDSVRQTMTLVDHKNQKSATGTVEEWLRMLKERPSRLPEQSAAWPKGKLETGGIVGGCGEHRITFDGAEPGAVNDVLRAMRFEVHACPAEAGFSAAEYREFDALSPVLSVGDAAELNKPLVDLTRLYAAEGKVIVRMEMRMFLDVAKLGRQVPEALAAQPWVILRTEVDEMSGAELDDAGFAAPPSYTRVKLFEIDLTLLFAGFGPQPN